MRILLKLDGRLLFVVTDGVASAVFRSLTVILDDCGSFSLVYLGGQRDFSSMTRYASRQLVLIAQIDFLAASAFLLLSGRQISTSIFNDL